MTGLSESRKLSIRPTLNFDFEFISNNGIK